jgi:predicted nucleic acid-binding protein
MRAIVLDSTPLGLLTQRPDTGASVCRRWLDSHIEQGAAIVVPEIVDYELRRELIRAGKTASIQRLDRLVQHPALKVLPISSAALKIAARLWADVRRRGTPTADNHALDVDVILVAQILASGYQAQDVVVATTNVQHLVLFVPAQLWWTV